MPFHSHGSQMNGFPLPSLSSAPILPVFTSPILTSFQSASLNYCHGQAITLGRVCLWNGGREGGHVSEERGWQCLAYQCRLYVYRCVGEGVHMCEHACAHLYVCAPLHMCVCVLTCDTPVGQLLATHHDLLYRQRGRWHRFDICEG